MPRVNPLLSLSSNTRHFPSFFSSTSRWTFHSSPFFLITIKTKHDQSGLLIRYISFVPATTLFKISVTAWSVSRQTPLYKEGYSKRYGNDQSIRWRFLLLKRHLYLSIWPMTFGSGVTTSYGVLGCEVLRLEEHDLYSLVLPLLRPRSPR